MQIGQQQIIELLQNRGNPGDTDKARQFQTELPDQVDTDRPADLLVGLGINPQDLLGKLGGSLGRLGGKLGL
ncbi:MAG: hypothetical protein M3Y71_09730 [Actinomycetota bacterium]|nr:hypothetical protein [Actinomycetota bacterium]